MSVNNIKYKGRERNKRIKQTITITTFFLSIVSYRTTINQTLPSIIKYTYMSGSNIKYKGRVRNKSIKKILTITIFLLLIVTYFTTVNQTYNLLYSTSICQVVTSNIKVEKEKKD